MPRTRRTYTAEFKTEAVKLVTEPGYSVAEAARSLGLSDNLMRNWKQALQTTDTDAFPGHGKLPAIEEELRRLRAETKRLLAERDLLKKRRRSSPRRRPDLPLPRGPPGTLAGASVV
jgi:transposase